MRRLLRSLPPFRTGCSFEYLQSSWSQFLPNSGSEYLPSTFAHLLQSRNQIQKIEWTGCFLHALRSQFLGPSLEESCWLYTNSRYLRLSYSFFLSLYSLAPVRSRAEARHQ